MFSGKLLELLSNINSKRLFLTIIGGLGIIWVVEAAYALDPANPLAPRLIDLAIASVFAIAAMIGVGNIGLSWENAMRQKYSHSGDEDTLAPVGAPAATPAAPPGQ